MWKQENEVEIYNLLNKDPLGKFIPVYHGIQVNEDGYLLYI